MTDRVPRAVIADDDAVIRRVLGLLLEREGLEVHAATDGEEAVALVHELRPDVVFLDAMMPPPDGYDVCARIRAELDEAAQPRIVMITAAGQPADRDRARTAGVDHFVTKPFSPSALADYLRTVSARR